MFFQAGHQACWERVGHSLHEWDSFITLPTVPSPVFPSGIGLHRTTGMVSIEKRAHSGNEVISPKEFKKRNE